MTGVIHVVTALERGGAQRNTLETAARLHDPGRPQLVVTGRPAELDDEAQRRLGTRLLRLPDLVAPLDPLRDVSAAIQLAQLFEHQVARLGSPVVVHTHSSKAGVLGRLAGRAVRGVVVVHTVHGFGLEALGARRRWALEAAERIAAPAADVFVFVSENDRAQAEALGLLRHARARIIRSGVDPSPFAALRDDPDRRARARARWGVFDDEPLVVTVGNLKPQKDPLFHIDVLAAWRRRSNRGRLLFVGDGPLRSAVEAHARERAVEHALLLPGFVEDPRDALAAADAFLLASAWEGLPRSVLEATAAGLPCVVRNTGWASDLAWARHVTALPRHADAGAFADALVAATHPDHRRAQRRAGIPREFTLAGMLGELGELYDELIGMPRPTERPRRRRRSRRASGGQVL